ncbi:MAG TPA: hypothetical protein VE954_24765 [Oligoflexus sp.]|uniref:hypothetical protein n=1 Tax=Oligoflexus sp. TaxID=1971216 RepID=UPI002D4465D2|nr:hypothetical protein [Oligoflexus sp.]HYX36330.1 hypothetical protein [Oligoflexus sp.]
MNAIQKSLLIIGFFALVVACKSKPPAATGYKARLDEGRGAAGSNIVVQGTMLWNTKCMGCHGPLATTDKLRSMKTKQEVLDAKLGQPAHDSVTWPNDNEATALVKVLNP